jgi:hypothetical protein
LPFQKVDAEGVLARLEFSILFGYALNIFLEDLVLVFYLDINWGGLIVLRRKPHFLGIDSPSFPWMILHDFLAVSVAVELLVIF